MYVELLCAVTLAHWTSNILMQTWNSPGDAAVEGWSYHDLYDDEIGGLEVLGISEEAWDCHVNHYYGYWCEDIE